MPHTSYRAIFVLLLACPAYLACTSWIVLLIVSSGCANPSEPAAQQMLARVQTLEAQGEHLEALLAASKVGREYPGTKAAEEAASLAQAFANRAHGRRQAAEERQQRIAKKIAVSQASLSTLAFKHDDIEQISWYSDRQADKWILGKHVTFYFGISNSSGHARLNPLRMKLEFEGGDWIFAKTVSIKTGGSIHHLAPDEWRHTNSSGTVWESCDVPLSTLDGALLLDLVTSNDVKVRFEGRDRYSDFVVPKKQLDALRRVYGIWQNLDAAD